MELSSEAYIGESIINEITVDTLIEVVTEKYLFEDGNQCELLLGDDTVNSGVQYAILKLSTARNLDGYSNGLAQDAS